MEFTDAPEFDPNEELRPIVEEMRERAEKLGLYLVDVGVATQDVAAATQVGQRSLADLITKEDAEFGVMATFTIGEVAWRKRTLDASQDEIDKKVQGMLPTAAEEIQRRLREGGSLFDDDDE